MRVFKYSCTYHRKKRFIREGDVFVIWSKGLNKNKWIGVMSRYDNISRPNGLYLFRIKKLK